MASLLAAVPACSDSSPAPTDAGADAAGDAGVDAGGDAGADVPMSTGPRVRFDIPAAGVPQPGQVPFPTDLYQGDADGTLVETLDDWSALGVRNSELSFSEAYGSMNGFGRVSGGLFVLQLPEGATVTVPETATGSDAAYAIVDVDPMSPGLGTRVPAAAGYVPALGVLAVQPEGVVLEAGRRYAVVVTAGVTTSAGPLGPSDAFRAIRDDVSGARISRAGILYGDAVERVVAAGIARQRIAGMAVFTTQTTDRQLRRVRDALVMGRYGAAPQLNTDAAMAAPYSVARFGAAEHAGWTATLDAWMGTPRRDAMGRDLAGEPSSGDPANTGVAHDAIGAVVSGTFNAPEFRRPWTGTAERDQGTIAFDSAGDARAANMAKTLPLTLVLPRAAAPSTGYPVVIFGHGLGGQRKQLFGVANELARAGIATLAVDTATFGQRAEPSAMYAADRTSLFRAVGTYQGPDGLPDNDGYDNTNFFGGLSAPLVIRDNIRQTALDYVQLRRLAANPMLDLSSVAAQYGGTAPRLDGTRVGYIGNSLGGIIGTVFAAIEPEVNPFVLNVPGAGLVSVLGADSPSIGPNLVAAGSLVFRYPPSVPVNRWHPLATLFQGPLDGADPGAFAATAASLHDVYFTFVDRDHVVPNRANELLARAMGLPLIRASLRAVAGLPAVDGPVRGNAMGRTRAAMLQFPAGHGSNLSSRYGSFVFAPPFPREAMTSRFPMLPSPVRIRQPVVAYQRSVVNFFRTAWMGAGMATIDVTGIDSYDDFDDDGFTAAEESSMGMTDPLDPMSRPTGMAPRTRDVGF